MDGYTEVGSSYMGGNIYPTTWSPSCEEMVKNNYECENMLQDTLQSVPCGLIDKDES